MVVTEERGGEYALGATTCVTVERSVDSGGLVVYVLAVVVEIIISKLGAEVRLCGVDLG